jgi:hypothetical protein
MAVVIVSGLPRSGTSLMMQMLQAGGVPLLVDHIRRADEDNPKGYFEFEPVKQLRKDASWLEKAEGRAVKVIYRLLYELPDDREYRVIFMRRPLGEVLRSQAIMLERRGVKADSANDAALEGIFERELRRVEDWLMSNPHMVALSVSYPDTLSHPEEIAMKVAGFLGLELKVEEMVKVVTPSLHRQRVDK